MTTLSLRNAFELRCADTKRVLADVVWAEAINAWMAASVLQLRRRGRNPIDVSIQDPQLQPPPASGDNNIPPAGIVLNQQSGRRRFHCVVLPRSRSHTVTWLERKKSASVVQA